MYRTSSTTRESTHFDVFNVVKIGCGLAGFKESEIAPMFYLAPENVRLSDSARRAMRKLCKEHCAEEDLAYTAGLRFGAPAVGM